MAEEQYDADDERTALVDRADDANETILVDRGRTPVPAHAAADSHARSNDAIGDDALGDNDRTVVKHRAPTPEQDVDDDGTIIRDRAPASLENGAVDDGAVDDGTVVVDRDDKTVVRERVAAPAAPAPAAGRRGRRRITLPPVEPGFGAAPVDAVGPGAVDSYVPRPVQQLPAPSSPVELGADATRAPAPSMPSVARRSRVLGLVAVGGFAAACLVSVVGLATIVVTLLS